MDTRSRKSRRGFLKACSSGLLAMAAAHRLATSPAPGADGEVLYNGIRLSSPWPPRAPAIAAEPMPVPYLDAPPDVLPIDVGRQLFVDDFLIEHTTLRRTFHAATYHA